MEMTYKNKEAVIRWRENNKEKYSQIRKECSKRYYQKNKELLNEKRNEWGRNRTERIKELEEENKKLNIKVASLELEIK